MEKIIDCFMPYDGSPADKDTVRQLQDHPYVNRIFLLVRHKNIEIPVGCRYLVTESPTATKTLKTISQKSEARYTLLHIKQQPFTLNYGALERMVNTANDSGAAMIYADHYRQEDDECICSPSIDYQEGSLLSFI